MIDLTQICSKFDKYCWFLLLIHLYDSCSVTLSCPSLRFIICLRCKAQRFLLWVISSGLFYYHVGKINNICRLFHELRATPLSLYHLVESLGFIILLLVECINNHSSYIHLSCWPGFELVSCTNLRSLHVVGPKEFTALFYSLQNWRVSLIFSNGFMNLLG